MSRTFAIPQVNWDGIPFWHTNTAEIIVTDSNGVVATTTYTFVKGLADDASLLEGVAATEDAYERISQKRDALAAQVGLSAGSTFDAISAQLASGVFKKFAEGTAYLSSDNLPFYYSTGTTSSRKYITVTGLDFKPSLIAIQNSSLPLTIIGFWDGLGLDSSGYYHVQSGGQTYQVRGNAYVVEGGFRIPFDVVSTKWIAIGG